MVTLAPAPPQGVRQPEDRPEGRPDFLAAFLMMNPGLVEAPGTLECPALWDLLTTRHCCESGVSRCYQETQGPRYSCFDRCFLDCIQRWTDTITGLPVLTSHPECSHEELDATGCLDAHEQAAAFLSDRGLGYCVSNGSWHSSDTPLVVIARPDVLARISLPVDEDRLDLTEVVDSPTDCRPRQDI